MKKIEKKDEIIPLEVKYSSFESPKISRGFRSFISEYKPQKGIVLNKDFFGELKIDSTLIKFIPAWYV